MSVTLCSIYLKNTVVNIRDKMEPKFQAEIGALPHAK